MVSVYQCEELPQLLALHVAVEIVASDCRAVDNLEGKAAIGCTTLRAWHTLHHAVIHMEVA